VIAGKVLTGRHATTAATDRKLVQSD
jgi:hypothetical protein